MCAEDLDHAIRQIISRAIASDEVVDIFAAAGLKKPDIRILCDEFLAEVRGLPHKNLAVETLRKLLNNEIKIRSRKILMQSRSFAEMLEASIRKYPPDEQEKATQTILQQAELLCADWAELGRGPIPRPLFAVTRRSPPPPTTVQCPSTS